MCLSYQPWCELLIIELTINLCLTVTQSEAVTFNYKSHFKPLERRAVITTFSFQFNKLSLGYW